VSCTRRAADLPHPSSEAPFVQQNSKHAILPFLRIRYLPRTRFVRAFPKKVKVEDVETTFLCETSFKGCKSKMWNRSFRARLPSKTAGVEDVTAKLSCKTSHLKLKVEVVKTEISC